ncbi:MAG: DUF4214 domain-containing protein [Rhodoferax sp.]|jgi:hypothetical protein|nr:DUF4214 domain-containing protein [Rhodoferax sp.]
MGLVDAVATATLLCLLALLKLNPGLRRFPAIDRQWVWRAACATRFSKRSSLVFVFCRRARYGSLHRAPDAVGHNNRVDELRAETTREAVLIGFAESPENRAVLIG